MANGYEREEINEVVSAWSEKAFYDVNDLPPDELTNFVNYLKELPTEDEKAS